MRNAIVRVVGSAALTAMLATPMVAQEADWLNLRLARQMHGVESLSAEIEYFAGQLNIEPLDERLLYDLDMRYDGERFEPVRKWELADGHGKLFLSLAGDGDDVEMDLDDWHVKGGIREAGSLDLALSREIPTDLKLSVGAAEVNMDLGGVPLTSFDFETGASATDITFDSPNPVHMERMKLSAGAAEFEIHGLGNARFDLMQFEGAVGEVKLDFSGDWAGDARVEIQLGLGALEITLPENVGARLTKDTFLVDVDSPGFTKIDGVLQSENWESADYHLEIDIDAAFGAVEIRWE